ELRQALTTGAGAGSSHVQPELRDNGTEACRLVTAPPKEKPAATDRAEHPVRFAPNGHSLSLTTGTCHGSARSAAVAAPGWSRTRTTFGTSCSTTRTTTVGRALLGTDPAWSRTTSAVRLPHLHQESERVALHAPDPPDRNWNPLAKTGGRQSWFEIRAPTG